MLKDKHRVSIQNTPSTSSGKIRISFKSIDFYRLWGITKKDNCGRTSQNILFRPQPLSTPALNHRKCCRCGKRSPCSPSSQPLQKAFRRSFFPHRHRIAETAAVVVNRYHASPSHRPSRRHFHPRPLTISAPNRGKHCRCGKRSPCSPSSQPLQKAFRRSFFPHRHRIAETAAVVVNRYHASPSHSPSRRHFRPQPLITPAPNYGKCCRCGKCYSVW